MARSRTMNEQNEESQMCPYLAPNINLGWTLNRVQQIENHNINDKIEWYRKWTFFMGK